MRTVNVATSVDTLLVLLVSGLCVVMLAACGGGGGGRVAVDTSPLVLPLPSNHGLTAGQLTIPAGASEEHGNVVISCPAGGPACVVTVADDGSASYDRVSGVPSVAVAHASQRLPSNHGLTAGQLTIPAGTSEEHGSVEISCPAGGPDCVITVAADGSASYDKTGGMPSVAAARDSQSLPAGHGLTAGQFTVPAGASEEHGNVVISCPAGGPDCVITVSADGFASYDKTGGMPTVVEVLMPGPGLLASDASPVVASTDADTLEELRDDSTNVFPALNAMLYRATTQGSEGTSLSTDFAVESIQENTTGGYVIRYTLDGTPGELTITDADLRRTDVYRVVVDGTTFDFWFKTDTRNEPFSRYMDSAYLGRASNTGQHRSWFIFGVRTNALPSTGSAEYLGRFEARAYRSDNPDHNERQHITGAMRLVANFDMNQLHGVIDAIRKRTRDGEGIPTNWSTSSFELTDGRIVNGQFTATLIGKDSDPNATFDESLKDFTGSILGEFYGPDADEVGAVVTAERGAVGQEYGRSLYGYVVGKNIERFRDEAAATGLEPLAGRVYGTGTKALIVMLHGTVSSGGYGDYMYRRAEDIAKRLPDATVVAVLGPGYYDREGRVSQGSNHERRSVNTRENNELLALTIQNLKTKISPEQVIAVGHSVGAMELGVILARHKGLVDGAVLVAGAHERPRPVGEVPFDFVDDFDRAVKVVGLTGTHDTSVPPEESQNYVAKLKELGVDARLVFVKGADHGWRELNDSAVAAIGGLLNELEPGLGDTLVRDNPTALLSGPHRDRDAGTTSLFSDLERPTVESTDDGFRITYVVDGQRRSVELSGADFGADPARPESFSKETADTEFRIGIGRNEFEHFDISSLVINWPASSVFSTIIYGARTGQDMPTAGTANYAGRMEAIDWPTDAAVRTGSPLVMRFRGDLSLSADFGNSSVSGNITALESRPGDQSSYASASGGLSFNGSIDGDGISATDLTGSGALAHYSSGTVNGAFYGPGAAEVAGVFEAEGTAGNRLLTGYFAGEKE